jgi:hypothetical protein
MSIVFAEGDTPRTGMQRSPVLISLDREQEIVRLDVLPFRKSHTFQESLHACSHIDLPAGLDTANELDVLGDVLSELASADCAKLPLTE